MAVPRMSEADIEYQIDSGTLKNACIDDVDRIVANYTPLIIHGIYGSAVIMGNTANRIDAPKNEIAPENKLPKIIKRIT